MVKQKITNKRKVNFPPLSAVIVLVLFVASYGLTLGTFKTNYAEAQSIQDQINSLQQQNAEFRSSIDRLQSEATSYQDAINKLQSEINSLQIKININTAEQARLKKEIKLAEEELIKQKKLLGENIKAMYLEGEISTLEMLASSKDLSEFVDKEQYRDSVKDKIKSTLDKVTLLKAELVTKEKSVEKLLRDQQAQQAQLAASRSEQTRLLSYNQSQQEAFNQKTKDNESKIEALIAEQRRANFNPDGGYYFLRFPGPVSDFDPGAYPYANAGFSMQLGPCSHSDGWPDAPDDWGYCTRQCVSYAAWAVLASGRTPPLFYGNAKDWVANAYANGITVSRSPQPGDVAISTGGTWGHAMYVESVSGGTFTTSEYNTYLDGTLTYQTRSLY